MLDAMHVIADSSFAGVFRPARGSAAWAYDVLLVVLGSALIAVSAQLAVHLPVSISPVPITGQTFAVLLVGALYGSRRGVATVLAYIGEGLAGLPVFAAGSGGLQHLLGPTGGFLIGFIAAAYVTGLLAERGWDRRPLRASLAMTLGTVALFVPGLIWLATFIGPQRVIAAGLLPFLPGAVIKIGLAAALLPQGWAILRRLR